MRKVLVALIAVLVLVLTFWACMKFLGAPVQLQFV